MPRPQCCRRISQRPGATIFHPGDGGSPPSGEILLTLDEFEAIRLADLEGMYQEHAAGRMNVSRQTFGRILASAHRKVGEALTVGKTIRIEGGAIRIEKGCPFHCTKCVLDEEGRQVGPDPCPRLAAGNPEPGVSARGTGTAWDLPGASASDAPFERRAGAVEPAKEEGDGAEGS